MLQIKGQITLAYNITLEYLYSVLVVYSREQPDALRHDLIASDHNPVLKASLGYFLVMNQISKDPTLRANGIETSEFIFLHLSLFFVISEINRRHIL